MSILTDLFKVKDVRNRKIIFNSAFLLLLKIIALLNIIISVPLVIRHLDEERYGLYMAITSVLTLLNFADLGLGYGLQNSTSENSSKNNFLKLRKDISNIFFILVAISTLFLTSYFIFKNKINLVELFNVKSQKAIHEIGPGVTILLCSFFIGLPFSIVQKIQIGLQKGYLSATWQMISTIISIILTYIITQNDPTIPLLLLCISGTSTLFVIINFIHFVLIKNKRFIPNIRYFNLSDSIEIGKIGFIFFILQTLSIVCTSSDSLIISHYKGAIHVATFSIVQRIYMLLITPVQIFIEPLWPAFSEAVAKKDIPWIKKTFYRSIGSSFLASIFLGLFLVITGNFIIHFWLKNDLIDIKMELLIAFASLMFYANVNGSFCALLNSNYFIYKQLPYAIITNLSCLSLKIIAVQYFDTWVVVSITLATFCVLFFIPGYYLIQTYFKTFSKIK